MPNKKESTEKGLFNGTSAIGCGVAARKKTLKRAQKDILFAREKKKLKTF
jgi:hypothetical protein